MATSEAGARASKMEGILEKSLEKTLRACTIEKLTSCFPHLAETDIQSLQDAQEQMTSYLRDSCRTEFSKIMKERDVVGRLNELDEMVRDARQRKEAGEAPEALPLSEIPAPRLLSAHLLPIKRATYAKWSEQLQKVQMENAEELSAVEQERSQIEARSHELRDKLAKLEMVTTAMDKANRNEILVS